MVGHTRLSRLFSGNLTSVFFRKRFPNSFIVRSRSGCLFENSLNCTLGLVLLCFFNFVIKIFFTTAATFCSFVHAVSSEARAFFAFSGASFCSFL